MNEERVSEESSAPRDEHDFSSLSWKGVFVIFGYVLGTLVILLIALFAYFNGPGPSPREDVSLGVTFSQRYATDLGLNWRETYLAILDDLELRQLRLPVYWDLIEVKPGEYSWTDLDWQITEAEKRGVEIILAIGQRVPRWPECHIPTWVSENPAERESTLLSFLEQTVGRYRERETVVMWQVENEPFLVFFGECPPLDVAYLDEEIARVKEWDPTRPILLTDSGELSVWYRAAKRGDFFGTTLYRKIYKGGLGYVTYPIGPNFFRTKEKLVRLLSDQEHFMIIELQAEPWANGWVGDVSLEEQFITMNEHLLRENVDYARQVGFQDIYLWGAEWWYWLKVNKDYPAVWETAKELFQKYP